MMPFEATFSKGCGNIVDRFRFQVNRGNYRVRSSTFEPHPQRGLISLLDKHVHFRSPRFYVGVEFRLNCYANLFLRHFKGIPGTFLES